MALDADKIPRTVRKLRKLLRLPDARRAFSPGTRRSRTHMPRCVAGTRS